MIRKYMESEIPVLMKIWEEASSLAHPFLSAKFTKMVKTAMTRIYLPNSDTWVYLESDNIIGFISMNENEIVGLFVHPEHHSEGVGTKLVNYVKALYQELEVEVFEKNKIGRPFYEKNGFKLIKKYHHKESGEKVLRLKK